MHTCSAEVVLSVVFLVCMARVKRNEGEVMRKGDEKEKRKNKTKERV